LLPQGRATVISTTKVPIGQPSYYRYQQKYKVVLNIQNAHSPLIGDAAKQVNQEDGQIAFGI
ncbi:hypothetical protein KSX19_08300, partial [Bifidobacterium longum]